MPKPTTDPLPASQVKPEPALEKRARRTFSAEYKLRIVQEANACQRGELGSLLRREKLYHNQIQQWRRELDQGGVTSLAKTAPGPKPQLTKEQRQIAALEKKLQRLERQLQLKDDCLELQKKALALLAHQENEDDG